MFDAHRTAKIALLAHEDKLKYIIATENMRPGDLIQTSQFIPRNPGEFMKFCFLFLALFDLQMVFILWLTIFI